MSDHLTPERLAEIRDRARPCSYPEAHSECIRLTTTALLAHIDAQAATIQRVREVHTKEVSRYWAVNDEWVELDYCGECGDQTYPCPTIQALDGGQE